MTAGAARRRSLERAGTAVVVSRRREQRACRLGAGAACPASLPSAKRKGSVVVKIYEVSFKVDGQSITIRRNHLSNAPFKLTIHLAHVKPGSRLVLTAHALIAVKHGPKRSKTLRITLTACA